MKIAVLFPESTTCAWSMAHGLGATLRRMGHEVMDVPLPTERQSSEGRFAQIKALTQPIEW